MKWLHLSDNQLTGSIPPKLGQLSLLEELLLNNNHLTGSIPPELGQLSRLTLGSLNGNRLSGCIPPLGPVWNDNVASQYQWNEEREEWEPYVLEPC